MRQRKQLTLVILVLGWAVLGHTKSVYAVDPISPSQLKVKLAILETKLRAFFGHQDQLLQKQAEIKKELDQLRVWINRRR